MGEYKKINNSIKFILDNNEGVIEPTSTSETVDANMSFVFEENSKINHLLEKAAHLAFQLWLNQPFPDGNKRLARLSVAYLFMLNGLPLISFKAEGYHFNEGLLRSFHEKNLSPLIHVIETESKHQLSEIIELDKKLKANKTPPSLGFGSSLIL